ncbi:uncharacterized protein LOC123015662 [Tribolium madens]|uniref:uncharacterized protein LOC123015662 n=1 Tax=Tribolium madens TaxID=41895 RepID=UPI001CF726E0|nr:uncharacterized protein LOC123015662 [Tribolium madens]
MDKIWRYRTGDMLKVLYVLCLVLSTLRASKLNCGSDEIDRELKQYVDSVLNIDKYSILPGIGIERVANASKNGENEETCVSSRSFGSIQEYVKKKMDEYSKTHVLSVDIPATARFFQSAAAAADDGGGRNSFMAGFGMGFLAFALKKLLLPVFIGAQLVKSVLIAMFLPSILGGLGKVLGKGLSTFSGISGASAGINNNHGQVEDFEFKDTDPYSNDGVQDFNAEGTDGNLGLTVGGSTTPATAANSRFGIGHNRISFQNDNYYMRKPNKKTDYKVFHKIPSSSLLLTSYDPFYSPLLSRLDAVFQQLGLGDDKSPEIEKCRERLVCMMYANPAKYAPYSNLVSAQLSRELNELRKPASDNPDILRFFRYMKAAKDGQDGEECLAHKGCSALSTSQASPAILTTYNEINKLVQARKIN